MSQVQRPIADIPEADLLHPVNEIAYSFYKGFKVNQFPALTEVVLNEGECTWQIEGSRIKAFIQRVPIGFLCCKRTREYRIENPQFVAKDGDVSEEDDARVPRTPRKYKVLCDKAEKKFYIYDPVDNVRSSGISERMIVRELTDVYAPEVFVANLKVITGEGPRKPIFAAALEIPGENSDIIPGRIWRLFGYNDRAHLRLCECVPLRSRRERAASYVDLPAATYITARRLDAVFYALLGIAGSVYTYEHSRLATAISAIAGIYYALKRLCS